MSERSGWGEVGFEQKKGIDKVEMNGKGPYASFKVGPHAAPPRAARHGDVQVPIFALKCHLKPRATFSHPVRSSPTPGMPVRKPSD